MKLPTIVRAGVLALCAIASPSLNAEPTPQRDTATLLFENPDWANAPAGTTIEYDYARKTYGAAALGTSFDDTVALTLDAGDDARSRKVAVQMFSGGRRRPAGPFESTSTNPVLLLVFEDHVQDMARLFQANPRYLKTAIRKAWRDAATIEDVSLSVAGKMVPGTRITIRPFVNDPQKDRMLGLEGMTYVVDIANSVPGEIVAIDIHAPAEGAPKFSESLHYKAGAKP